MSRVDTHGFSIEDDMKPRKFNSTDKVTSKIFKAYPLLGDFTPKQETLNAWEKTARQYIEMKIEKRSARFYLWVYEQITLIIIHYAKSWNSNEEGRFTQYISMQFGYKDDSGKIWSILSDAVEIAFKQNNRFFVYRNGDREFYETVMVHSYGPNGAWLPLIDLLFSFYTDNLDWTYRKGDPLFGRLVRVLQSRFNYTEIDDEYDIASKKYSLRVGIRRLVQERPGYSIQLFELIVNRIQQLLKNETKESNRFLYKLVDLWFALRISSSIEITKEITKKNTAYSQKEADLALAYSDVTVRYIVYEGRLTLHIPSIRLMEDEHGPAFALLYENNHLLGRYELEIRGNELGETVRQSNIILPVNTLSDDELRYRIVITAGGTTIYDSENKLWRPLVFFSGDREVRANRLRKEKYEVFIPRYSKLNGKNIDIVLHMNGMCEMSLHKDFALEYAGNTVAIDTSDIKGVRIIRPAVFENAHYAVDGEDYYLVKKGSSLKIYYENEEEAKKYRAVVNDENHSLLDYYDDFAGNRSIIPTGSEYDKTAVSIIDIAAGTVLFRENYCYIQDFNCAFNRKLYVTNEEFENLSAKVTCGGEVLNSASVDRNEIRVDYNGGTIFVDVPGIQVSFDGITTLFFDKYIRADDISEEAMLVVSNRTDIPYTIKVGDEILGEKAEVSLSKYASENYADNIVLNIVLIATDQEYLLGQIVYVNSFAKPPVFTFNSNCLFWDGGSSYIGDAEAEMKLDLKKDGRTVYLFELQLGEQLVYDFGTEEFSDGQYDWVIYANGISIKYGNAFFGNISKARFSGKIIKIDQVTEDVEGNAKPVTIEPVYINRIKYEDTCFVRTEGDIYDVYSGCMYRKDRNGKKRYFSFQYNEKPSIYKINPVKIIYISDKYLRIVNEDDEGIYYYHKDEHWGIDYEITDREPSAKAKNYHDILFYLFETQDINPAPQVTDKGLLPTEERTDTPKLLSSKKPQKADVNPSMKRPSLRNLQTVSQNSVILAPVESRILVNAGPGTGKTWTLIERIIQLVREGIEPDTVQVLCFSRAAVEVVRKRMAEAVASGRVEPIINLVDIRTFDSFASQLLYWVKDSEYTEIGKNFRIENLNYEERIELFNKILKAQPGLIEQCNHLIVDEVQDLVLSRATMVLEMIRLLPKNSGVTLFGDACQAIYDYQVESGMSSDEFYKQVEELRQFSYYSFDRNYRQTTRLREYCSDYRTAILAGDADACNVKLTELRESIPEYNTPNLKQFEEDSLDRLLKSGNVGILTRSNAQALVISGMFHRKNIPHALQRRLSENYLNGWIAILFNTRPERYYDETGFENALSTLFPGRYEEQDISDIWNLISVFGSGGMVSVPDLLRGIRDCGRANGLYIDSPNSKVTVSTIHRSKGREYDTVMVLNNLLSDEPDSMEEQRVNYVALSRARDHMYRVELPKVYFGTIANRRCFTVRYNPRTRKPYLHLFEIGRPGDFNANSFCIRDGVQQYLRENYQYLKDREVYLEKAGSGYGEYCIYYIVLKENGMVLGETGREFADDLGTAIRKTKNLPWHAQIRDYVYPKRFNDIYIVDVGSEIGMIRGNETGIKEFDSLATWNIVLAEGYARAEY